VGFDGAHPTRNVRFHVATCRFHVATCAFTVAHRDRHVNSSLFADTSGFGRFVPLILGAV
jgi:hypothetical protein